MVVFSFKSFLYFTGLPEISLPIQIRSFLSSDWIGDNEWKDTGAVL